MQQALTNWTWVSDIQGAFTVAVIMEYFLFWDILYDFELQPEVEDYHIWKLSNSGQYSAKSTYDSLSMGKILFRPWERIWKTWAPAKCQFFLLLVAHKRCWTSDHLARRGLSHPEKCPLCDQADESIDHLLIKCIFSRLLYIEIGRSPLSSSTTI